MAGGLEGGEGRPVRAQSELKHGSSSGGVQQRCSGPDAGGGRLAAAAGLGAAHGAGGAGHAVATQAEAGFGGAHIVGQVAAGGVVLVLLGLVLGRLVVGRLVLHRLLVVGRLVGAAQQVAGVARRALGGVLGGARHAGADLEGVLVGLRHAGGACRGGGWGRGACV